MVDRISKVTDLEGMKLWAAEHDGRIDEKWAKQEAQNERCLREFDVMIRRMTAIEKKVMWISGVFAGVGSLLGTLLTRIAGG